MIEWPAATQRNWRVIHAGEPAPNLLFVVEGQKAMGMRPVVVALNEDTSSSCSSALSSLANGNPAASAMHSLPRSWQEVRNWRDTLLREGPGDLVHAHSFAAGMAAVRAFACVVYELQICVEAVAMAAGQCEPGSWMARSFRVAEQFVLSRAQAIVVPSNEMKAAVEERGANPENIFVISRHSRGHGNAGDGDHGGDPSSLTSLYANVYQHALGRKMLARNHTGGRPRRAVG
ncbi:MAG TPA: glycosyltransferase [Candidatus Angelobacter sp.]|nr:glycosyltransferase [Candidatus Angelobacter sp.]